MIATQTIPIFLAFEPDDAAARRVERYKERVRELVGEQLYLSDPPHMTLYLAMFDDMAQVIDAAGRCARAIAMPRVAITGWHAFLSDPLTGLNTLVLDFCEDDRQRLRAAQAQVVESLATSRDAIATLDRLNRRWSNLSPLERETACRWGFPYVGKGWHPHLTIGSIRPEDWPAIETSLLAESPAGTVQCENLQVFQLIDNEPRLIETFSLAAKVPVSKSRGLSESTIPTDLARAKPPSAVGQVSELKSEIINAIWGVVDRHDWVLSTTITGSFLTDETLTSISDIDTVVIVDELNGARFATLQQDCASALEPLLARRKLKLRVNPTLGPLKFNDDATAVLHLMLYSAEAHRQHVIKSPFTCFDWQRSSTFRKRSMASVYPVFALQPHHFVSSRRGIIDYLNDFDRSSISYRELVCSETGYDELRKEAPMSPRDRYEYAYHVMRFLMQNLLKLIRRDNLPLDGEPLVEAFAAVFPTNADVHAPLYLELRRRKKARDFNLPISRLADRLREFVHDFETQFRTIFFETATRHVLFRHAPTKLNGGVGDQRAFVGQSDPDIDPISEADVVELAAALREADCKAVHVSPLKRCRQTIDLVNGAVPLPPPLRDPRLIEINYGRCDGFTVAEAKRAWPSMFEAWSRGEDPNFPGGECTADVWTRASEFVTEVLSKAADNAAVCTHNVVLRCLVGYGLGVPRSEWHRIRIPHFVPITLVQTRDYGWFIDLDESVEARLLADFTYQP